MHCLLTTCPLPRTWVHTNMGHLLLCGLVFAACGRPSAQSRSSTHTFFFLNCTFFNKESEEANKLKFGGLKRETALNSLGEPDPGQQQNTRNAPQGLSILRGWSVMPAECTGGQGHARSLPGGGGLGGGRNSQLPLQAGGRNHEHTLRISKATGGFSRRWRHGAKAPSTISLAHFLAFKERSHGHEKN